MGINNCAEDEEADNDNNANGDWDYDHYQWNRPLSQVVNAEIYASIELELGDIEDWKAGS